MRYLIAITLSMIITSCTIAVSVSSAGQSSPIYRNNQDFTVITPGGDATFYRYEKGIENTFSLYNYETGERQWYEIPNVQPPDRTQQNSYYGSYNPYRDNHLLEWDWRNDDSSQR